MYSPAKGRPRGTARFALFPRERTTRDNAFVSPSGSAIRHSLTQVHVRTTACTSSHGLWNWNLNYLTRKATYGCTYACSTNMVRGSTARVVRRGPLISEVQAQLRTPQPSARLRPFRARRKTGQPSRPARMGHDRDIPDLMSDPPPRPSRAPTHV